MIFIHGAKDSKNIQCDSKFISHHFGIIPNTFSDIITKFLRERNAVHKASLQ